LEIPITFACVIGRSGGGYLSGDSIDFNHRRCRFDLALVSNFPI